MIKGLYLCCALCYMQSFFYHTSRCWDLVFVNYSSAYMCNQILCTFSLFWRQTRASRTQFPRVLQRHTEVWKPTGTQVSTTIDHSGPHDPWGHQANISPVLHSFFLFRLNSPRGAHLSFCSTSMEEKCSLQLTSPGKPPPNQIHTHIHICI